MLVRFKIFALALISCLAVSQAFAENEPLNSALILNGGLSKANNACSSPWVLGFTPESTCSENHTALRLAYSYQFAPVWGLEVSYGDLGNAAGNGTWTAYGTPAKWSMKVIGWSYAGTATVPIGGGFSLLGKIGTVRAEFSENLQTTSYAIVGQSALLKGGPIPQQVKSAMTYGIGIQYDYAKTFALRAQYENFGTYDVYGSYGVSLPRISLSLISAGAVIKF